MAVGFGLGSKEHDELLAQFERVSRLRLREADRVKDKEWQRKGQFYNNGEINRDFINYRNGYSFGKLVAHVEATEPEAENG